MSPNIMFESDKVTHSAEDTPGVIEHLLLNYRFFCSVIERFFN